MSDTQEATNIEEEKKETGPTSLTKDDGVTKTITQEGTGKQPKSGDEVEVHYKGSLEDGTEFDCSYDREPLKFSVGKGMVIKGWDLGILSMKVGEKATLNISSAYGYGDSGSPPKIPGGATLIFDVELISVGASGDDEDTEGLTDEQLLENSAEDKAKGNEAFKSGDLEKALTHYRQSIMSLDDIESEDLVEAKDARKLTNLNLATVLKKMEKWTEVIKTTSYALEIEATNLKALYFRAIAHRMLKDFGSSIADIKTAIKAHPKDKTLRKEFETIKEEKKKHMQSEKELFGKAFEGGLYEEKKAPAVKSSENEVPKYDPSNPKVFMDITLGDSEPKKVIFELFKNKTPLTAENFRCICTGEKENEGEKLHYKGNIFHRVIKGFMAQGGDITNQNGTGGCSIYGNKFEDEQVWIPHSEKGLLSMANSGPNTNGSQFFITFLETPHLNEKHTVFGRVIKGWDVVQEMEAVETESSDVPKNTVTIHDCGEYTEDIAEEELDLIKE